MSNRSRSGIAKVCAYLFIPKLLIEWGGRDGSEVKSMGCSFRGPERTLMFNLQYVGHVGHSSYNHL